jgi:hypothetical protein
MDAPFARHEAIELESAPLFSALREQDTATSQLLGPDFATDRNKQSRTQGSIAHTHLRADNKSDMSHVRLSVGDASSHERDESINSGHALKQGVSPSAHVLWKGNPFYALTWDLLGIFISVLFLGMLHPPLRSSRFQ